MNIIHTIIKQSIVLVLLSGMALLLGNQAAAQDTLAKKSALIASPNIVTPPTGPPAVATVSGPSTVPQGTASSAYTESGLVSGSYSSWTWSLTNSAAGTIDNGSSQSTTVTWNPSFTGSAGIQFSATNSYGTTQGNTKTTYVYLQPVIGPAAVSVNYNDKPALSLTSTVDAGASYQWQSSPDGGSWTNITGAYSTTFTPAAGLTTTTYYRLTGFNDGVAGGYTSISNTSTVSVYPQLVAGAVLSGLGDQTVYYNHGAAVGCQAPTGGKGSGSYTYLWQRSPDGNTWTTIPGAAATTSIVTPVLTAKTYFHVIQSSNGVSVTGATITVSVYPQIQAGTVSPLTQAVNYSALTATIVGQPATGGNGTFTYQWQSSATGAAGSWANIPGATGTSYVPGNGVATTYFHLVSTAPNGDLVTSATALITVYPQLVTGTIAPLTQSIYYGAPPALSCAEASGGNGAKTHQWQSSPTGAAGTFTNVPLATGLTLPTTGLTATTYFQLISSNSGVNVTSATATVTVYPQLVSGTGTTSTPTVYYSTAPALSCPEATGGNGTKTHQWQSSPSGTAGTFTNITGATSLTPLVPAITATTYYQMLTTNGPATVTSNVLAVAVYPQLVTGLITPATQSIYFGNPPALSCAEASGGNGAKTHQWKSSPSGTAGTFTNVTGATGLILPTASLTATTYFQMITTNNLVSVTSATATVTVYPQLVTGTLTPIAQSINYSGTASITGGEAAGGNGTKTHQWQSSPNGTAGTFTNVTGATGLTLSTGTLTASTWYQLITTNNGVNVTSATANVTVYPQLAAGSISPVSQAIPYNTKPDTLSAAPSGGNGTYTYQWQSSADNITFPNITGATAATYIPPVLSATTYFRALITSNGAPAYTTKATVIVTDCRVLGTAPTAGMNYVVSSSMRTAGTTNISGPAQLAGMTDCDVSQTIQYIDGLGRPIQTIQVKGSPGYNDVVQPVAYDQFGREATQYLPYTMTTGTSDGSYKANALTPGAGQSFFYNPTGSATLTQQANGIVNTSYPSGATGFEPSPLNRVVEQGAPGASWQLSTSGVSGSGHTRRISYGTNSGSEVIKWAVNSTNNGLTGGNAFYGTETLYSTTTVDENGYSSIEYKDMDGRVVCKKTQLTPAAGSYIATYYVYNDLNNLSYVIPPQPAGAAYPNSMLETDAVFTNLIYSYHYDERNRLIEKKIPGKGWEFMVYNSINQVIFTQDAVQRSQQPQVWTYIKYDAFGRIAITGLWSSGTLSGSAGDSNIASPSHILQQWLINWANTNLPVLWVTRDSTQPTGYSNINPQGPLLTVNYYDDYNGIPTMPSAFTPPAGASNMVTGLLTATKTAVLNSDGSTTTNLLSTSYYYDDRGRNIKTYQQHYLGGAFSVSNFDEITNGFDFTNAVTQTVRKHHTAAASGNVALTLTNNYDYDHAGRKTNTWEQINTGANILLSRLAYNELGQLYGKHLHSADNGTSFLQDISYAYNERGWLSKSNAPLFEEMLQYNIVNGVSGLTPTAQYNGNIASQSWGTTAAPNTATFLYLYDPLNRLTSGSATTGYKEKSIVYDQIGNITALQRYWNNVLIDDLQYNYKDPALNYTNQLLSISDATTNDLGLKSGSNQAYSYDGNGNMKTDNSNALTVSYNLLNLPAQNTITGGTVNFTYDATGKKLRKVSTLGTGSTTEYISGIQYNGAVIDFVQTEEGRVLNPTTTPNYEYSLTDHLGNSRVTFDSSTGGLAPKQTDYYMPFGMEISQGTVPTQKNEYLYNKKELQEELGQYDYGARFYNPVIARWTTIDPLAEASRKWSPYTYVMNNPIRLIDPDGMSAKTDSINKVGADGLTNEQWLASQGVVGYGSDEQNGSNEGGNDGGKCCVMSRDHSATVNKGSKGPSKHSITEIIELFRQLNNVYGGFFAKFNPKVFKYPKTVNRLVNFVNLINSKDLGEVGDKVASILVDKGLEYISLGEVKAIYDGLDFIYNGTMQGNLEMMARYQNEIQNITAHYDYSRGMPWRKTLDTYQQLYEESKERYIEAYNDENGIRLDNFPK